jgi:hypothetical protein
VGTCLSKDSVYIFTLLLYAVIVAKRAAEVPATPVEQVDGEGIGQRFGELLMVLA